MNLQQELDEFELVGENNDSRQLTEQEKFAISEFIATYFRGTPSAKWRATGEPDPHAGHYDGERAALLLGDLTDDELANGAFLNYDTRLSMDDMLNPTPGKHMPIVWMTAVKERIRWLSRSLEKALAESKV